MDEAGVEDERFRLAERVDRRRAGSGRRTRCRGSSSRMRRAASTRRSGFTLRRRQARSIGVPPCEMLRWIVRRRSSRAAGAPRAPAPDEPRPHAPGEPRGERVDLGRLPRDRRCGGCRRLVSAGADEAASRRSARLDAAPLLVAGAAFGRGRAAPPAHSPTGEGLRRAGSAALRRAGAGCGACRRRARTRRRARRSARQSDRASPKRARAGPASGARPRKPAGERGSASASRLSARPTAKPLARKRGQRRRAVAAD